MLTDLQKRTAQAIVNIFETGKALGDYGQVTLLEGDTGQLTYGRSQTTLASGNLYLLIKAYCSTEGCRLGGALSSYLPALDNRDSALNGDAALRTLLKEAGDDPAMQSCQDAFFDRVYWQPASLAADRLGIATALGVATVYDSTVHGSWSALSDRTIARDGTPGDIGERRWIADYIATRRDWLASSGNALLHKTVYRMDALQLLVEGGKWDLPLPLKVRGVMLDEDLLTGAAPVRASAQIVEERLLRLRTPYLQGEDVRALQKALQGAGFEVDADGVFGPGMSRAVIAFQQRHGLTADGIVGPATRAALGL